MDIIVQFLAPITGLLGVFIGVTLNEAVRRRNRRESYSQAIFERRLAAYEGLARVIYGTSLEINEALMAENDSVRRLERIDQAIQELSKYTDDNRLYLNEEIVAHSIAMFVDAENIPNLEPLEGMARIKAMNKARKQAYQMIKEDSGISEMERLFKSVNRPKIESEIISYFRSKKRPDKRRS